MTNLIQNYTNSINQNISSFNRTTKMYYNNLKDADSDNLLKPLDGKGYLVNESPLNAPKEFVRDAYYTTKALQKGVTGKANDNELGKMNDLGLKVGGLGIASYLMTKRHTPKEKAMEFIGFGSFLASMSLWPKIAIEIPTRLRFGFNPRKQYYDEQGRKKYVTQDPNYIPFDLFKGKKANEDLGKIGDRMGISRNIKDRDEITKEQIRKISVQDNTLWMLTAGVATPTMTALICNRLEKPVGKYFENRDNKRANELADKIAEYNCPKELNAKDANGQPVQKSAEEIAAAIDKAKVDLYDDESKLTKKMKSIKGRLSRFFLNKDKKSFGDRVSELFSKDAVVDTSKSIARNDEALADFLESKVGKTVSKDEAAKVTKLLMEGFDIETKEAAAKDLSYFFTADKTVISSNTAKNIMDNLTKVLDTQIEEGYTKGIITQEGLTNKITEFMQSNDPSGSGILDAEKSEKFRTSMGGFFKNIMDKNPALDPDEKDFLSSTFGKIINETMDANKTAVLTEADKNVILKTNGILNEYAAVNQAIKKVSHFKVEQAPETILGNHWGEVSDTLVKGLGISKKEMKEAIGTQELTKQLFTRKLEALVKDPDKYQKFVRTLGDKILELDERIDNPRPEKPSVIKTIKDALTNNAQRTKDALDAVRDPNKVDTPLYNLAKRLVGTEVNGVSVGGLKDAQIRRIEQARIVGVQSAYMRLLKTVDFFKRADDFEADIIRSKLAEAHTDAERTAITANPSKFISPQDKAVYKQGKEILMSSHAGDFYKKFETMNNRQYYGSLMWRTFRDEKLHPETEAALSAESKFARKVPTKIVETEGENAGKEVIKQVAVACEGHEMFKDKTTPLTQRITDWGKRVGDLMLSEKHDFMPEHVNVDGIDHLMQLGKEDKTAVEKFYRIGSTPDNILYKALKDKHNSGLWFRFFGGLAAATLGVTLLAQLGFGKKDSSVNSTKQV